MKQSTILAILLFAHAQLAANDPVARQAWTESTIQGTPDPPKPYVAEPVFEKVGENINQGLEMVALDGRLFVMERGGKIWSFPEDQTAEQTDLFVDLKALHPKLNSAYGLVFDPNWQTNHFVYLAYTVGIGLDDGTRLSRFRFRTSDSKPPRIEPDSEEIIFTWLSGGHNGASLQFGPDGMLYISTGDAAPPSPPDGLDTGQDNSDVLSCILRIEVRNSDVERNYRIPPDNPFIGRENVRPEIWAFGFRNPWKMSFDQRGRLWVGDVGWELWEMIHLVEKGGNSGWSAMEASNPVKLESASDLAPITAPIAAHPHTEAASITGGFEYQGSRLPELRGAYIYGDYETGKIWALRHDGKKVVEHTEIADTPHKISTFGVGNDGELYYIHYGSPSTIYRLAPNPRAGQSSDFPRKLSATGLFSDVGEQMPSDGVYEFNIHEPMWQDGARAKRFIALPDENQIHTEIAYQRNGSRRITLTWPENAVLAKTIRLGKKPVETQLLHYDGETWNGYSYRWNDDATDAELVDADGEEFEVSDQGWKGGTRYRIPSRAECMRCHNMWNQFTPAFEPMQLAEFVQFPRQPARDVAVELKLTNADFFHRNSNGQLVHSRQGGSLEQRARSWLHANCAHCHRRHGGGSAPLEVNFERPLSESATLWELPTRGDFGLSDARVIIPGQPWRSVLNYRVSSVGNGHMPPLGSHEVDENGAKLLWEWVAGLPNEHGQQTLEIELPLAEPSSAMQIAHLIATGRMDKQDAAQLTEESLASPNQNISALFERFRPAKDRPALKEIDPQRILSLQGNPNNGASLLFPSGKLASCFACHKVRKVGGELGPDLNQVGTRLNRQQLLESLIAPSKTIAPEYRLTIVETNSDEVFSGFVVEQNDEHMILKLATGKTKSISAGAIKATKLQPLSPMPEGLLNLLTEQEAADLLAYLETLRGNDAE